jgi:hypothetical protein
MTFFGPPTSTLITNTFEIAPESARPPQMHARLSTSAKTTSAASVTILSEQCAPISPTVNFTGSKAVVLIGGEKFVFDKKSAGVVDP